MNLKSQLDPTNPTIPTSSDTEISLSRGCGNTPSQIIDISRYSKDEKIPYCLGIDWQSITFDFCTFKDNTIIPDEDSLIFINELIDIIYPGKCFDDFEFEDCWKNNYKKKIVIAENIELLFLGAECLNGNQSMMIDITGNGMKRLSDNQIYKLYKFSFDVLHLGKITRHDPNIDNHTELCNIWILKEKVDNNMFKSDKKADIYYGENQNGLTIYFGLRSNFLLRIYDKNAEQESKDSNYIKEYDNWTRFEIQSKDPVRNRQFALMFMIAYEKSDMNIYARFVADVLAGIVTFLEWKNKRTKKDLIPWKEWVQLLEGYSGIKLRTSDKASHELDKKIDWCNRSVFNSLAMIYVVFGEKIFKKWMFRAIGLNLLNINDSSLSIINGKNEEMGVLDFGKDEIIKVGRKLVDQHEDLNGVLKAFIKKDWLEIQHDDELINK